MQIQKGIVKYKDRSDIICTYGLVEDGRQYYFLDGNTISNGNIIASTVLVEAIDPVVVASSIGVIDPNGNVVIPFENRSVKAISDKLLLVEKANSTTPSVVEANKLRSDPLAATRLVTTPATIKEKINVKMGSEGRFVFNDQFSEATICDIDGKNLINDEYYSFIGFRNTDNVLFLSKNVVDSPVVEYSVENGMFVETPIDGGVNNSVKLDVTDTEVTQEVIDNAMTSDENKGFGTDDITAKDFEAVASQVVTEETDSEKSVVEESQNSTDEDSEVVETTVEEAASEQEVKEESVEEVTPNDEVEKVEETEEVAVAESEDLSDINNDVEGEEESTEIKDEEVKSEKENIDSVLMGFNFEDNINYGTEDDKNVDNAVDYNGSLFDTDLDNDIFADSTLRVDKIVNDYDTDYNIDGTDTIIEDVASTMSDLINLNRSQRQKITAYEEKIDEIAAAHKRVVEKARSQVKDIETMKAKIKNYETAITKLEGKVQLLETKVHDQDRLIANQTSELEALRPQLEGKKELVKILADAQVLLDQAA